MIHHITRATRHLIFWSLIATAIGLTGVRLMLVGIDNYKSDIAARLGELMGAPVKIGHIRAKMRGFSPELVLTEIDIASANSVEKPAVRLREIRLGLNLLDTLISRDPLPSSWVTLVGAKLTVKRKPDGSFAVVGLKTSDEQPLWLLQGRRYEVLQSEVLWQDEKSNGRPLKFEAVDVAIINNDQRHRINIMTKLPKKYGGVLTVSMALEGNIFEPKSIHGVVFAEGRQIKPAELASAKLPFNIKIHSGSGNFKIWSSWRQTQPVSVQGIAQFQQLKLGRPDKPALAVNKLETGFSWTLGNSPAPSDSQWQLHVHDFLLDISDTGSSAGNTPLTGAFNINARRSNGSFSPTIGAFVGHADLQSASAVVQFFAPGQDRRAELLKQARLKGQLQNFSIFADGSNLDTVAVNGRFSQLGFAPLLNAPGINSLSGRIKGSGNQGVLYVAAENARLDTTALFRAPLAIQKLKGALNWRQTDRGWLLSGRSIELDTADIESQSRLRLMMPKNHEPAFLDLQSTFAINDVSKAKLYLPIGIMDNTVVDWLDRAFISGRANNGKFLFYGKPRDFPFAGGEGVFEVLFEADQFDLSYHPEWPHLTGVNADVLFIRDSLQVDLHEGRSTGVKIRQAQVTIPSMNSSDHLLVLGELEGGIGDALGFMQQTPFKFRIDPVLAALTPHGDTRVALNLKIPLEANVPAGVDVTAQLNNAGLTVKAPDLPVTQLKGKLKFNDQGVYSDVIRGTALGYPVEISVKNSRQETVVKVNGRTGAESLQRQFKLPFQQVAKGTAEYQVQLHLPAGETAAGGVKAPDLTVQSTLEGMALDLPNILAKTKAQKSPLALTFRLTGDEMLLPCELTYDDKVKAALTLNIKKRNIESGHIVIGDGEALPRHESGIKFDIDRDQLALQDWLSLAVRNSNTEAADIREINIHSAHALWQKSALGIFDLALKQQNGRWAGTIGSMFANGKIVLPAVGNESGKIELAMEKLDISALKQIKFEATGAQQTVAPETLPLFNLVSAQTLWQSVDLGHMTVETARIRGGIAFKRIELIGPDANLTLTGDWTTQAGQSLTQAKGRLEMSKAGSLLARLGITNDLAETSAVIDFTARWHKAPYLVSLPAVLGQAEVVMKNGRILSIEPGFGRVLGVLAMAQWLKRLQLDFSDVYEEGLTFNTIKGRFDLSDGKATTHNLVVDAVPAKITINGNTDLVGRTVDHIVNVAPKSADAVPIAGTIMGKVAALVARSLTGKEQEGFLFGSQYLVKGEWGNAQIIPLHENDGLLQKTWNGITAFPWLEQPGRQ